MGPMPDGTASSPRGGAAFLVGSWHGTYYLLAGLPDTSGEAYHSGRSSLFAKGQMTEVYAACANVLRSGGFLVATGQVEPNTVRPDVPPLKEPSFTASSGQWRADRDDCGARGCSRMGVASVRRHRGGWCGGGCRMLGSVSDRAWGDPDDPLERMAEGRLGAVAELRGKFADGGRALLEACQRDVHAPAGDVLHGRLTDQLGKPSRER